MASDENKKAARERKASDQSKKATRERMASEQNKKASRERTAGYRDAKKKEDPKCFAKKAKVYREKVKRELEISDSSDSSGQEDPNQVDPK